MLPEAAEAAGAALSAGALPEATKVLKRSKWCCGIYAMGDQSAGQAVAEGRKKIAIVGSGIAGLSCAYLLSQGGHEVTLFEREGRPGMDAYGVDLENGWVVRRSWLLVVRRYTPCDGFLFHSPG